MSEAPANDSLTMLVYALDEMRETTNLLPLAELSRSTDRPWWRKVFFAFARSRAEVGSGLAVQYLSENLERARGHWREAISLFDQLQQARYDDGLVMKMVEDLRAAGLNDVLRQLDDDAVPSPITRTAEHLAAVVAKIRNCEHIATSARGKLLLQRIRDN